MPDWSRMTDAEILHFIGQDKDADDRKISIIEKRFREIQRKTKICDFPTFLKHAQTEHAKAMITDTFKGDWLKFADMMITTIEFFEEEK